jgi:hypothetical protein
VVPAVTEAGAVFVTATSEEGMTVVTTVLLLFAGLGSASLVTVAVFVSDVTELDAMLTVSVNCALVAADMPPKAQVTVPPLPGAGVVQLAAGPLVWLIALNVVPAGSVSLMTTSAGSGPPLETVIV